MMTRRNERRTTGCHCIFQLLYLQDHHTLLGLWSLLALRVGAVTFLSVTKATKGQTRVGSGLKRARLKTAKRPVMRVKRRRFPPLNP